MLRNEMDRWGPVSQGLHWLTAVIVIGMFGVGLYMAEVAEPFSSLQFSLFQWHKSFGVTVIALSLLRLGWLITGPRPADSNMAKAWENRAAKLAHIALYVLLLVVPLTGWIMTSASTLGLKSMIFGVWELPQIVSPDKALHETFEEVHESLAWTFMGLVALHIGAALRHHFIYRDNVLIRMLPWSKR